MADVPAFTCTACAITFTSFEAQKAHFRIDWHRYNLKRKIVDLPPVTESIFKSRLAAATAEAAASQKTTSKLKGSTVGNPVADSASPVLHCPPCHSHFSNDASFKQHLQSKKHLKKAAAFTLKKTNTPTRTLEVVEATETDSLETEETMVADLKSTSTLTPEGEEEVAFSTDLTQCFFCPKAHKSNDLAANLAHMQTTHGFFIPDVEYLCDLEGFLTYVAEKIQVGMMCLHCCHHGKVFTSAADARQHMRDKFHCKLRYTAHEDLEEFTDFYDFTASYEVEGLGEQDASEVDEEAFEALEQRKITFSETGEMVLPDGRRLGTRQMRRYYQQRLVEPDSRPSTMASLNEKLRLAYAGSEDQYTSALSHYRIDARHLKRNKCAVLATGQTIKQSRKSGVLREKHRGRLQFRSHKLQHTPKVMICV